MARLGVVSLLSLTAALTFAQGAWLPDSPAPVMSAGVDPAFKQVITGTVWAGSAFTTDHDTYKRKKQEEEGYEYRVIASTAHSVSVLEVQSGTQMAFVLSSFINGTATYTHTIKALEGLAVGQVEVRVDRYLATDGTGNSFLKDGDIEVSRTVTITGPSGQGGGG